MRRYIEAYVRYIRPILEKPWSGSALFINSKSNRANIGRNLKDFITDASDGSLHVTCTVRNALIFMQSYTFFEDYSAVCYD